MCALELQGSLLVWRKEAWQVFHFAEGRLKDPEMWWSLLWPRSQALREFLLVLAQNDLAQDLADGS